VPDVRAILVTVDPERDSQAWLKEYMGYLRPGFTALTGTAGQIRATADAWEVRYARVETGTPGVYSMSHTADVYLVDGDGTLRAQFPFGTPSASMIAVIRAVLGTAGIGASPPAVQAPIAAL